MSEGEGGVAREGGHKSKGEGGVRSPLPMHPHTPLTAPLASYMDPVLITMHPLDAAYSYVSSYLERITVLYISPEMISFTRAATPERFIVLYISSEMVSFTRVTRPGSGPGSLLQHGTSDLPPHRVWGPTIKNNTQQIFHDIHLHKRNL